MQLRDVMTRDVEIVNPDATLQEAAQKMRDLDVGSIPVCDGRRLQGMLTDRDITIRATADGLDPRQTKVNETMTEEVYFCYENQNVEDAALIMMDKQIRRLPIVNMDKDLVGIVSLGDLAVEGQDSDLAGDALEEISKPSKPDR